MCSCFGFVLAQYHAGFEICINSKGQISPSPDQPGWSRVFFPSANRTRFGRANDCGNPAVIHGNPTVKHA
jgi:hypothetical protein